MQVALEDALQLRVVLVRTEDPVLLQQARDQWGSIRQARRERDALRRRQLASETDSEAATEGSSEGGTGTGAQPPAAGRVTAGDLGTLLEQTWARIPVEPVPVLSPVSYAPVHFHVCLISFVLSWITGCKQ